MAATAGILAAIGSIAGAGTGIASAAGAFNRPSGGAQHLPTVPQTSTADLSRALLPGVKADAAARSGGGISPEFLANLVTNATGEPGAGLDILSDIRKSLGPGI